MHMKLTTQILHKAYFSGFNNISNFYKIINKLNVFPVPDGDTGTNMMLTFSKTLVPPSKQKITTLDVFLKDFNEKILLGARGNSGVILSQIFVGIHNYFLKKKLAAIEIKDFVNALESGKKLAYQAVMEPVEGTILTIIRRISEEVNRVPKTEIKTWGQLFGFIKTTGNKTLDQTPNMLTPLKEAGVVDSGGFGLVRFFEGMAFFFENKKIIARDKKAASEEEHLKNFNLKNSQQEYGYCTEVIIKLNDNTWGRDNYLAMKNILFQQGGNSIVHACHDDLLKLHVHLKQIGPTLTFLQQFGDFHHVKIENMSLQSKKHELSFRGQQSFKHQLVFLVILPTHELGRYFNISLTVKNIIVCGKFMNPDVDEIRKSIQKANAAEVFVLPNNKNAFLTVEKAASLEKQVKVTCLKSQNVAGAVGAIIRYDPTMSCRKNINQIKSYLHNHKAICISNATKQSTTDNIKIKKNDFVSVVNGKITMVGENFNLFFRKIMAKITTKTHELAFIFVADHADPENLNFITKHLGEFWNLNYEIIPSGNMIYSFIIDLE